MLARGDTRFVIERTDIIAQSRETRYEGSIDMAQATFRIWRGDKTGGEFKDYTAEVGEGMVVLDAVHQIQATQAPDLACRWNCKAGKCGSCSAEINGMPKLMCMTRLDDLDTDEPDHRRADAGVPAHQGPRHRRVVELRGEEADQAVQAAEARQPRRHLADAAGGRGPRAGVPQVHRVLPVPGRVPRSARPPQARRSSSARGSSFTSRNWR